MSVTAKPDENAPPKGLIAVLFTGVFMAALDTAIVGPAIPVLRETFGVDNRAVGLVMSVFVLFSLCSTALMANLSDRYGRRPIYLFSVSVFALGSLLIALSPSFWMVVASRAVQGMGAGGITPTASAVVGDMFAPEKRGKMLGLIGATYGMAFVLGPPLASALMVALSWHWIFLLNLPIAAVILYLGAKVLPQHRSRAAQAPLDVTGIAVTFVLLSALVLGITRVLDPLVDPVLGSALWPWLLLAVALLLALLVVVERRATQPLIPIFLFENRQLATTYLLAAGAGYGMGSVIFLTSIATHAYGVTSQHAGFVLLPMVVCSMLGSGGGGRLLNRLGARTMILLGFAMLSLGYGLTAITSFGLWLFLVASVPVGLGVGIVVGGALRSIAIDEAPQDVRAAAQGLINICTAVGTLTAAATISALADFSGGGVEGFAKAYYVVAALMATMLLITLGLRKQSKVQLQTA
ncbi:MFS transporter [Rhodoferax sp. GW822-FHT02A01]|uniref:MFS transporter n=1 Tax=Rhodoferax sp. GW822-FHT02A01 TaxID=3141537 RepID=UPI00315CB88F